MTKKLFIAILMALCGGCATVPKEAGCARVERLKITEFDPECFLEKVEAREEQKREQAKDQQVALRYAEEDVKQRQIELAIIKKEAEAFRTQRHINRLKAEINN